MPGIPSADLQNGTYDWGYIKNPWNLARKDQEFPALTNYVPLYRYHDSWTVHNEFTIDKLARGAVSVLPFFTKPLIGK